MLGSAILAEVEMLRQKKMQHAPQAIRLLRRAAGRAIKNPDNLVSAFRTEPRVEFADENGRWIDTGFSAECLEVLRFAKEAKVVFGSLGVTVNIQS